jgi:anti-sigma factor RsiW
MTADEARELFSAAYEGELDDATKAELEAALKADPALHADYEAFRNVLYAASRDLGNDGPDLLSGVQKKLRARSKGRFYGDRFAERGVGNKTSALLLPVIMVVVLTLAWLALQMVSSLQVVQ